MTSETLIPLGHSGGANSDTKHISSIKSCDPSDKRISQKPTTESKSVPKSHESATGEHKRPEGNFERIITSLLVHYLNLRDPTNRASLLYTAKEALFSDQSSPPGIDVYSSLQGKPVFVQTIDFYQKKADEITTKSIISQVTQISKRYGDKKTQTVLISPQGFTKKATLTAKNKGVRLISKNQKIWCSVA